MKLEIEGIVLKQTPYKEKDAMISVLTKDGIVSFLAHNVLAVTSKNKSACLPYTFSLFNLNSRNDKLTLSQAKIIKSYAHLYSSFEYLASINLINECINKFIDEEVINKNRSYFLIGYEGDIIDITNKVSKIQWE